MHIMFSIDTSFYAPQNLFHMTIMELHVVESCVRGFHVYQDILMPPTGECLSCQMEDSNAFELYFVAIRKSVNIIGHVPQIISAVCSLFIQRGTLTCIILDSHCQYSHCPLWQEYWNYYMKIILAKFKFGGLVMILQFAKLFFC